MAVVKSIEFKGLTCSQDSILSFDFINDLNVFVGPNGSGKTTLARIIYNLLEFLSKGRRAVKRTATDEWDSFEEAIIGVDINPEIINSETFEKILGRETKHLKIVVRNSESLTYIYSIGRKAEEYVLDIPSFDDEKISTDYSNAKIEHEKNATALKHAKTANRASLQKRCTSSESQFKRAESIYSANIKLVNTKNEEILLKLIDVGSIFTALAFPDVLYIGFNEYGRLTINEMIREAAVSNDNRSSPLYTRICKELSEITEANIDIWNVNSPKISIDGVLQDKLSTGTEISVKFYSLIYQAVENAIVIWDEPENGLHPTRRVFFRELMKRDSRTFIVTTHATEFCDVMGDSCEVYEFRAEYNKEKDHPVITVSHAKNRSNAFQIAENLGIEPASSLFTANAVIWVEGPTELVFWKRMFELHSSKLQEGFDYSLVMYGGSNLSHFALDDEMQEAAEFVDIFSICKRAAILCDSDYKSKPSKGNEDSDMKPQSLFLKECVEKIEESRPGAAFFMRTDGREIENYIPDVRIRDTLQKISKEKHSDKINQKTLAKLTIGRYDRVQDAIIKYYKEKNLTKPNSSGVQVPIGLSLWGPKAKVRFMREILKSENISIEKMNYGFKETIDKLVEWIESAK